MSQKELNRVIHRPVRESEEELDDIFARQKTRKLSQALTLQYENVMYVIEPLDWTKRLTGKSVMVYENPDATVSIKYCGRALQYLMYD